MAFFDEDFKALIRHFLQNAIFACLFFALAVGASYGKEFLEKIHQAPWVVWGAQFVELFSFGTDLLLWCILVLVGVWEASRNAFSHLRR
jgi:hypothetical protein